MPFIGATFGVSVTMIVEQELGPTLWWAGRLCKRQLRLGSSLINKCHWTAGRIDGKKSLQSRE